MKYIKLFEEHASVYRKKYDEVEKEIQSSIYDDINNIFDRLNVEILKTEPKTYGVPTINGDYYLRDLIKDGSKITYRAMKPDDGNELEEHIYDMSTSDLISVYEYFENINDNG